MRRRTARPLAAAALLAVAAAAAPGRPAAPEPSSALRILVPISTSSIPFFELAREGTVRGAAVSVETFASHPQALALLLRGEADLLFTGTSQGWENRLGGSPIVMVGTGIWGVASMVGVEDIGRTPAELKGRRIALPFPGAPLDFQTRYLLERAGLDPDRDLEISYGAFTQSIPRLLAGQLDAAALPEPQATEMVRSKGLVRLFSYADAWAAAAGGDRLSPQVSLFASDDWLQQHRPLVVALVDAWRAASRQVAADPTAAAAAHAAALGSTPAIVEEAIRNTLYEVPPFDENRSRVLAYYDEVLRLLPGEPKRLDIGFFFVP